MPEGAEVELLSEDLALLSIPLVEAEVPEALSPAEQEVALKVYAGASNQEIARARGVSAKTIGHQLESIYRKLGVSSRIELVLRLRGRGDLPRE
jgi:DNA-binding NarL/FixJ family response regulator